MSMGFSMTAQYGIGSPGFKALLSPVLVYEENLLRNPYRGIYKAKCESDPRYVIA